MTTLRFTVRSFTLASSDLARAAFASRSAMSALIWALRSLLRSGSFSFSLAVFSFDSASAMSARIRASLAFCAEASHCCTAVLALSMPACTLVRLSTALERND